MRFEILGPLGLSDGDDLLTISGRKVEVLLTVLLIRSEQVVSKDQIMAEIWGGRPPARAHASLHVYISKLRKFLDRPGHTDSATIVTRSPGYLLRLGSDTVDFQEFLRLAAACRRHARAGRHQETADCAEAALDLWRGPVLNHVPHGPIVQEFLNWLTETHTECTEILMDARLHLGRHREIIGPLRSLTAAHPLREVFYEHLMLALHRSDRKAEALAVYRTARSVLNEELGLEPCQTLQDLHQAILTADTPPQPTRLRDWGPKTPSALPRTHTAPDRNRGTWPARRAG